MTLNLSNTCLPDTAKLAIAEFLPTGSLIAVKRVSKTFAGHTIKITDPDRMSIQEVVQKILDKNKQDWDEWSDGEPYPIEQVRGGLIRQETYLRKRAPQGWDAVQAAGGLSLTMNRSKLQAHVQKQFDLLRKSGILLFRSEFVRSEDPTKFRVPGARRHKSGALDRVFGAEYLRKKFVELGKDNYNVPRFVVVIEDYVKNLSVDIRNANHLIISSIKIEDGEVLTENIDGDSDASSTSHQWMKSLGYSDYSGPGNILRGRKDDNYYVVDTEIKSFQFLYKIEKTGLQQFTEYAKKRFEIFNPWLTLSVNVSV